MKSLRELLAAFRNGSISEDDMITRLSGIGVIEAGYARLDGCRTERKGFPEIIYGQSKPVGLLQEIAAAMIPSPYPVIMSRVDMEKASLLLEAFPDGRYFEKARIFLANRDFQQLAAQSPGAVAVMTAGSSDIPVAEEAAVMLEIMGYPVERVYDVGVAGIHRLFREQERISGAAALIVVAGMDGVLPSVAAGLFAAPLIAVPTSVGYGASFDGLSALLTMLNSCVPGVMVVNIDNGLGAALSVHSIFHRLCPPRKHPQKEGPER